jgi:pimeloyl-ACP methyl ester carboxylesterase
VSYIERDGVRLYAEETGTGPAVVWVHEFAADHRAWEGQVRRFSRDFRCLTYNARGYPPSDVPDDETAYSYEEQREDLRAVLDGFGVDRAHIVGLSMGAYAGLQFALRYPERTRSLLFASGGSGAPPADQDKFGREADEAAGRMLREGMPPAADGLAMGATRIQLHEKDPRGWLEFRGYLAEHSPLGSALTLRGYQARRPSVYDFELQLRELDVPVLLAVGDEDDPVIEVNVFLKRVLPRAGLWMCPKTGHGINLEEPDDFNDVAARFFGAVEGGRWGRRDPRAGPAQSVFMGDRPAGRP